MSQPNNVVPLVRPGLPCCPRCGEALGPGRVELIPMLRPVGWLAELLAVSEKRAYDLLANGIIPAACLVKLGRQIRVREAEVLAWLRSGGSQ